MKREWLIGTAATAAIVGLIAWIANNTYWDEVTIPTMPRGEAATNPFYAAQRFAEALGATAQWRRTMAELPDPDAVMVLTYWNWDLIDRRREQLEAWVESGGRLLLDNTLAGGEEALREWSGLGISAPEYLRDTEEDTEDDEADFPPTCRTLRLALGQSQVDPDRTHYSVCTLALTGSLTSAREAAWALEDDEGLQAIRVLVGEGSVTLVNASPFGNRDLLEEEHGLLFVDATTLRRGDHVVFLSEELHASLLDLIWQYGSPAVVLALLLIVAALWRNTIRFGPLEAQLDPSRRSLAEQIRGTGQFAFRVGGGQALHAAMVRALFDAARLRVPHYDRLSQTDRIAAIARLADVDAEALAETVHFHGRRTRHEFKHAVALLDRARSRLVANGVRHWRVAAPFPEAHHPDSA